MKQVFAILFFLIIGHSKNVCAQPISGIINIYTKVLSMATGCNGVDVLSVTGFSANDRVVIMQMKVIGNNMTQTNGPTYGDVPSVGNAGNYEFAEILGFSGSTIYFKKTLQRTYTPLTEIVQLIRVPQYTDITISGTLTAQPWDGTTGGVLVFEASGTVTFAGTIDVSSTGFKGGLKSGNGGDCGFIQSLSPTNAYFYNVATNPLDGGGKGEGIAMAVPGQENGKGKHATGGGGGGNHNNGGGGGGNYGGGGSGGNKSGGCYSSYPNEPGVGGLALNTTFYTNALNKIALGSGGGGGHQNNLRGRDGGIGGGIVIIRANALDAAGNFIISKGDSVGYTPGDNGDGNGGGGSGGTVLLDVQNYNSALTIDVRGGAGGNTYDGGGIPLKPFGPGGGGGGGVVWLKSTNAFINSKLDGGNGGTSLTPSPSAYGATNGTIGAVIPGLVIPESATTFPTPCLSLSVKFLNYQVTSANSRVKIDWATSSEKNNKEFILERSSDLKTFELVKIVPASGSASSLTDYEVYDLSPYAGISYYRLKQIDQDGVEITLGILPVHREEKSLLKKIYPNPFSNDLILETSFSLDVKNLKLFNAQGIEIPIEGRTENNTVYLNTSGLSAGIYILQMSDGYSIESERIVKLQE